MRTWCCEILTKYYEEIQVKAGTYGGDVKSKKNLVSKLEWKRPLERSRQEWEDNIKIYFKETGCEGMGWMQLAAVRFQRRVS
jgi:hypothetical protein